MLQIFYAKIILNICPRCNFINSNIYFYSRDFLIMNNEIHIDYWNIDYVDVFDDINNHGKCTDRNEYG